MDDTVELVPLEYKFNGRNGNVYQGYEQVMLKQNGCPVLVFHVDLLWTTLEHRDIHDKLRNGETVECRMIFEEVK